MLIGISPHGQTLKFAPTLVPYESLEKIISAPTGRPIKVWETPRKFGYPILNMRKPDGNPTGFRVFSF